MIKFIDFDTIFVDQSIFQNETRQTILIFRWGGVRLQWRVLWGRDVEVCGGLLQQQTAPSGKPLPRQLELKFTWRRRTHQRLHTTNTSQQGSARNSGERESFHQPKIVCFLFCVYVQEIKYDMSFFSAKLTWVRQRCGAWHYAEGFCFHASRATDSHCQVWLVV